MDNRPWVHGYPHAGRRGFVFFFGPDDGVERTGVLSGRIEGEDALAANGGEDGLVRFDRSEMLDEILGVDWRCKAAEGNQTARNERRTRFVSEREHWNLLFQISCSRPS